MSDELEVCEELINRYIDKNRKLEEENIKLIKIIDKLKCCENCDLCGGVGDREEAGCDKDCAITYGEKFREGITNHWRNSICLETK